jgi:hypothetical protein
MKDTITTPANNSLAHAKALFTNVKGAPFRIGDTVKVIQIADFSASKNLVGKIGTVKFFEYSCGCGQSYPCDPMIGVCIGNKIREFWKEELSLISCFPRSK